MVTFTLPSKGIDEICHATQYKRTSYEFRFHSISQESLAILIAIERGMHAVDCRCLIDTRDLIWDWGIALHRGVAVPIEYANHAHCTFSKKRHTRATSANINVKAPPALAGIKHFLPALALDAIPYHLEVPSIDLRILPVITEGHYSIYSPWEEVNKIYSMPGMHGVVDAMDPHFINPCINLRNDSSGDGVFKFTMQSMLGDGYHIEKLKEYFHSEINTVINLINGKEIIHPYIYSQDANPLLQHALTIVLQGLLDEAFRVETAQKKMVIKCIKPEARNEAISRIENQLMPLVMHILKQILDFIGQDS